MFVDPSKTQSFKTPEELRDWFAENHATQDVVWAHLYKKGSGFQSITWGELVVEALAWGWIDSTKKSNDDASYFQRISPRRQGSSWSKINCGHVERLIKDGRMQPSGLAEVESAKADGRWDKAYAGQADLVIPQDFLDALGKFPEAFKFYETLSRSNLFIIYHQLFTAKKPETRQNRMDKIIEKLVRGEKLN